MYTDIKKQHMNLNNGDNQTKYPDNLMNSQTTKKIQLHNLLMPQCMLGDMANANHHHGDFKILPLISFKRKLNKTNLVINK